MLWVGVGAGVCEAFTADMRFCSGREGDIRGVEVWSGLGNWYVGWWGGGGRGGGAVVGGGEIAAVLECSRTSQRSLILQLAPITCRSEAGIDLDRVMKETLRLARRHEVGVDR